MVRVRGPFTRQINGVPQAKKFYTVGSKRFHTYHAAKRYELEHNAAVVQRLENHGDETDSTRCA
jgi:hypothetical protein